MTLSPPRHVMPVCFHPTIVILVDDNKAFLENLTLKLSKTAPIKSFTDPKSALKALNQKQTPFTERCFHALETSLKSDKKFEFIFEAIAKEIYNNSRFKEQYLSVIDYAMPKMNGIELCQQITQEDIYVMMLTGEAEYEFAKPAFDQGLLVQFIRKDHPNVNELIVKYIHTDGWRVFENFSFSVVEQLLPHRTELHILYDSELIKFLKATFEKKQVCEFYLFDQYGSYLLLDRDANPSWIFVRSDDDMEESIELAKKLGAPDFVIKALTNREKILGISDENQLQMKKDLDWNDYLHALTVVPTSNGQKYYYAMVDKLVYSTIKQKNILSFNNFLNSAT